MLSVQRQLTRASRHRRISGMPHLNGGTTGCSACGGGSHRQVWHRARRESSGAATIPIFVDEVRGRCRERCVKAGDLPMPLQTHRKGQAVFGELRAVRWQGRHGSPSQPARPWFPIVAQARARAMHGRSAGRKRRAAPDGPETPRAKARSRPTVGSGKSGARVPEVKPSRLRRLLASDLPFRRAS